MGKVLVLAAPSGVDRVDLTSRLRQTVFLLTLAHGAWIVEIAALQRGNDYVRSLPSGWVRLPWTVPFRWRMDVRPIDGTLGSLTPLPDTAELCP